MDGPEEVAAMDKRLGALRDLMILWVVRVDPLLWFQPRPTVLPRDLWEWSSLPWWSEVVGPSEPTYLV